VPTHMVITRDIETLADLRAFHAELVHAGLPDDTVLHVKTRVDWRSRHGARLTQITATSATPDS